MKERDLVLFLGRPFTMDVITDKKYEPVVKEFLTRQKNMRVFTVTIDLSVMPDEMWMEYYNVCKDKYPIDPRKYFPKLKDLEEFILVPDGNMTINFFMMLKESKQIKYCIVTAMDSTADVLNDRLSVNRFDPVNQSLKDEIRGEISNWDQKLMEQFNDFMKSIKNVKTLGSIAMNAWYYFGYESKYVDTFVSEQDMKRIKKNMKDNFDPYTYILAMCNELDYTLFFQDHGLFIDTKTIMDQVIRDIANEKGLSPREVVTEFRLDIIDKTTEGILEIYRINEEMTMQRLESEPTGFALDAVLDAVRRSYIFECANNNVPFIANALTQKNEKLISSIFDGAKEFVHVIVCGENYDKNNMTAHKIAYNIKREENDKRQIEDMKEDIDKLLHSLMGRINNMNMENDDNEILN